MPLIYTVNHDRRRVSVRGVDPISTDDVIARLNQQAVDGAWGYTALEDLRGVQWVPTSHDLRVYLTHVHTIRDRHGPRGPLAFVIAGNLALFGMFRMYSILGEQLGLTIGAFHSIEEAERWLDGMLGEA